MSWHKIKFGTDGWRAIIAEDFTFENVELASAAIAKYLNDTYPLEKPALISYDPRFLADKFALRAGQVINSFGREVLIVDRDTPTPVIAYAAKFLNSAGALQFTASHNPPEYCGIKYIPDFAGPADEVITQKIKDYVDELGKSGYEFKPDENCKVSTKVFSPKAEYLKAIEKLVDLKTIKNAKLKIGLDSICGAGRGYLNEIIDCVVVLGQERDPLFRGMLPEPTLKTLEVLIQSIKSQGLNIGLSNDGDADRFAILDEAGVLYTPNQILAILTKYLYEKRGLKGAIVRTVATTHLLDVLAGKLGLEVIETPVGFKYICEQMRKTAVLIGGEESGGLSILGHIPEKDGILACLLVCEALAVTKKTLSQLWNEVLEFADFEPFSTRLDLHLNNQLKEEIMNDLRNKPQTQFAGRQVSSVSKKDGVKLILDDNSWVLVRPSGTEPLLRVYLEASSAEALNKLKEAASKTFGANEKALAGAH
jgi:alpha-D-glucose phosphate-specific phosphoglucomutase